MINDFFCSFSIYLAFRFLYLIVFQLTYILCFQYNFRGTVFINDLNLFLFFHFICKVVVIFLVRLSNLSFLKVFYLIIFLVRFLYFSTSI